MYTVKTENYYTMEEKLWGVRGMLHVILPNIVSW